MEQSPTALPPLVSVLIVGPTLTPMSRGMCWSGSVSRVSVPELVGQCCRGGVIVVFLGGLLRVVVLGGGL